MKYIFSLKKKLYCSKVLKCITLIRHLKIVLKFFYRNWCLDIYLFIFSFLVTDISTYENLCKHICQEKQLKMVFYMLNETEKKSYCDYIYPNGCSFTVGENCSSNPKKWHLTKSWRIIYYVITMIVVLIFQSYKFFISLLRN